MSVLCGWKFLFLINGLCDWIASGWEAHSRNYRYYVSVLSVSTLNRLPNFPHKATVKRHGLTWPGWRRVKVHSLAMPSESPWECIACLCVAGAEDIHYIPRHHIFICCLICEWWSIFWQILLLHFCEVRHLQIPTEIVKKIILKQNEVKK